MGLWERLRPTFRIDLGQATNQKHRHFGGKLGWEIENRTVILEIGLL
jgi:hypothetical protein